VSSAVSIEYSGTSSQVEKAVLLQTLDHLWREHLVTLDHLRHRAVRFHLGCGHDLHRGEQLAADQLLASFLRDPLSNCLHAAIERGSFRAPWSRQDFIEGLDRPYAPFAARDHASLVSIGPIRAERQGHPPERIVETPSFVKIKAEAREELARIDGMGGALAAVGTG